MVASHLHSHKLEKLASYGASRDYQQVVVMETVVAMVNLTKGNPVTTPHEARFEAEVRRTGRGFTGRKRRNFASVGLKWFTKICEKLLTFY